MKKLKIMVVAPYFYPESGGVANHTYNLYKNIVKKGYDVVVITSGRGKRVDEEVIAGMKVYRLPVQFKVSNTPISFKWKKQIEEIIKKEKPDLINGHMPVPFMCDVALSASNGIPFIIKYHHGGSMKKGKFFPDLLISIYEATFLKRILKKSVKIITPSDFVTREFIEGFDDKKLTIPPGVNLDNFKPNIKFKPKNKVLFVGNLIKSEDYKGLNYLLESLFILKKDFPEIKLTIVGGGDYQEHYKNLAKKLGLKKNVIFKGKVKREKMAQEYQKTNLLVLPSLFDATPNVLLEAMACKKPVVGTNVGGVPYLIKDNKNGFLVEPKNPDSLSKAIIKILKNKKLGVKLGRGGHKIVREKFTWKGQADKTIGLYEEVMRFNNGNSY
jgi:glycosyltransferase involved in cell wall biosynthesis